LHTTKITNALWRTLIVTHRYFGIAVGLLMATWFVSGIVMMYVGFPQSAGSAGCVVCRRSLGPTARQPVRGLE
jgi:hypothetical protein